MSDLIRRKDAIREVEKVGKPYVPHPGNDVYWCVKAIEALPSAEKTGLYCTMAGRECFTQGKEIAWCLTCPHISEEDRELVKKAVSAEKTGKRIVDMEIDFLGEKTMWYVCDQCRKPIDAEDKYCKHCGAKMVGDTE